MTFFDTPLGEVGADEMQVLLWLAWQRYYGKHPAMVPKPMSAATLRNHLGSLSRALFECNLSEMPPWAILNQLWEWKVQDSRMLEEVLKLHRRRRLGCFVLVW